MAQARRALALLAALLTLILPPLTQRYLAGELSSYSKARSIAINQGWKPLDRNRGWRMTANTNIDNSLNNHGIKEFWGCSGIGENICHFYFSRKNEYLLIAVLGGYEPTLNSKVLYKKIVSKPEEMDF